MKNLNTKLMILLAGISLMGVGCSKNQLQASDSTAVVDGNTATGVTPLAPDSTDSSSSASGYTNSAAFTPVSLQEFNSYVATHPLNAPTNFKVTMNLQNNGGNRYGGTVQISYTDTGYTYNGTFTAGTGNNVSIKTLKDNDTPEAQFNYWYQSSAGPVFSGFFQDSYGSIVVIVDKFVSTSGGDAQSGAQVISGSIYYKNFAQSYATQSPYRKCWFIYDGPYNCRSSAIINKTSLVPDGYRKLGTFSYMSKSAVFQ